MVLDGTFKGFSVEGIFGEAKATKYPISLVNKIISVVRKYKEKHL